MKMKRAASILLALPPLLYSAGALLYGLLVAGMQCDEICRPGSSDWRYTSGAWQWYAVGGLGVVAFAAGILFFAAVVSRKRWVALGALLLGAASIAIALMNFLVNPGSDRELDLAVTFWLASAAVFLSGVLAVLLTAAAAGTGRTADLGLVSRRVVGGLAFLAAAYFLLGGVSALGGATTGMSSASYFGKAAILGLIGWGFWRGGFGRSFTAPRDRMD
jgi:hypothetical protein